MAVVGVPDDNTGERAIALVETSGSAGHDARGPHIASGNHRHGEAEVAEELRLVKEFPRTASGKVQKYKLRNGIRAIS